MFGDSILLLRARTRLAHAAQPAIVIGGLALHVTEHLWMRQDQELFLVDALHHTFGHLFRLQGAFHQESGTMLLAAHQQRRDHALRAKATHTDALGAMRDGQPFGERYGAVLGDGIGRRIDVAEKAGGRRGIEQIAFAAFQHLRQHGACRVHMRHDVQVPAAHPVGVGRVLVLPHGNAGIGAEQVDAAVFLGHLRHQRLDLGFVGDVGGHGRGDGADAVHRLLGAGGVAVGNDDGCGMVFGEALAHGAADARSAAGDDDDLVGELHSFPPEIAVGTDSRVDRII